VDNFPSFTELGQLPNWYEYSDREVPARPAAGAAEQDPRKNGGSLGSLEFASRSDQGPGLKP